MFSPNPDVLKSSSVHRRICAVVGNSGNLKGSHYGPLIDSHDVVMRMNFGPSKGYEDDVGTKTTHQIMFPESVIDLDKSIQLVLFLFEIQDTEWLLKAFSSGFTST
ncbi:CMP-N-acetylneuraminate-beta-galactosamide-alpha-2,3-sialyltransferase 1-like [Aulostomus maculatus]